VCGEKLTERGVAFVSYNAYPGNHFRDMARGMMRYHTAHFPDRQQQIRQARALLKFLAEAKEESNIYHTVLKQEFERVLTYPDAGFFHDDLNPINHPIYFHEFIAHASRHGLQYLSEADILAMKEETYPPHIAAVLSNLDSGDVIAREQYLDFLKCRAFRQTLLCRRGVELDRTLKPERLHDLYVAAEVRPASPSPDVTSRSAEVFQGPRGAEIETDRPLVKTALSRLGAIWPGSVSFRDLLTLVWSHLGHDQREQSTNAEDDAQEMGNALLQAYSAGYVELHVQQPPFVTDVSERPIASALARLQLQHDNVISTLRHHTLRIEDSLGRHLVMLLDGTRDRATLLKDLGELVQSGAATLTHEGKSVSDVQEALKYLARGLEANLTGLARSAVLVA
jgi:methyltransferase-like protein